MGESRLSHGRLRRVVRVMLLFVLVFSSVFRVVAGRPGPGTRQMVPYPRGGLLSGFRCQASGFRLQASGFRLQARSLKPDA